MFVGMISDRFLYIYVIWQYVRMLYFEEFGGKVVRDGVWGVVIRLDYQFLGCIIGFGGWEVRGFQFLELVFILVLIDFWSCFYSVLVSSEGKIEGFLGFFEFYGLRFFIVSWCFMQLWWC